MEGTSHDGPQIEENRAEELTMLIASGDYPEAGPRIKAGDEFSRNLLDNDDAATLEGYMQPGLWLERVGLVWIATKTEPCGGTGEAPVDPRSEAVR